MSVKRVSDCEAVFLDEQLQELIDTTYSEPRSDRGRILPKSKMEISWNENFDSSKFTSKAIDVVALCAIYTDSIYNKDIHIHDNKTIDWGDFNVSCGNVNINSNKDPTTVGKNITAVANHTSLNTSHLSTNINTNCNINIGGDTTVKMDGNCNKTIDGNSTTNVANTLNVNTTMGFLSCIDSLTITGQKIYIDYGDEMIIRYQGNDVLTFGHNDTTPIVKFSDYISQANPITGYINHALWS